MSSTIEGMLRRIPLFSALTDSELAPLAARCRRRVYPPRERLFREGDFGQTLYLIAAGYVTIERLSAEGTVVHLARRGPGEHFGELALFDDLPRSADAVTETTCDLLLLDRRDLMLFLELHPQASWEILRSLAARLREAADQRLTSETRDALGRLATCLLESAETAVPDARGQLTLEGLSDSRLAERIGTTRETVNRRLAHLKQLGIVRRDSGALVIVSRERLRALAET